MFSQRDAPPTRNSPALSSSDIHAFNISLSSSGKTRFVRSEQWRAPAPTVMRIKCPSNGTPLHLHIHRFIAPLSYGKRQLYFYFVALVMHNCVRFRARCVLWGWCKTRCTSFSVTILIPLRERK